MEGPESGDPLPTPGRNAAVLVTRNNSQTHPLLVGLRPQIHEADGFHAWGADFVELADTLGFGFEVALELLKPGSPRFHVGLQLAAFLLPKIDGELFEGTLVLLQLLRHATALALKGFAQVLALSFAAFAQTPPRKLG